MATTNTRIVIRRDVSTTWSTVNPELLTGEQGLETDTGKLKIGEGKTWNATGYSAYLPSEVDAKVSDEATVRAGVDNTLQTDLNGAKARIDVLEADATTTTYVDAQVSAEATARTSADDAEASARAAADTTLQGNIDTVDGRVDAEIAARGLAFDALDAAIAINTTAITTESTARQLSDGLLTSADQQLATDIDTLQTKVGVLETDPTTKAYVDAGLDLKADATELASKADVTALDAYTTTLLLTPQFDAKADVTALDDGLADKADADDLVDGLATKADVNADTTGSAGSVTFGSDINTPPTKAGMFAVDGSDLYISIGSNWQQITLT